MDQAIEMRNDEFRQDPPARCGFCGTIVDGDVTAIALESEAFAAHRDSIIRKIAGTTDTEVFACDDGEGCMA